MVRPKIEAVVRVVSQTTWYVFAPLVSAAVATVVLVALTRWRGVLLDRPNERSLHDAPVPRVGGISVIPAILVGWACIAGATPEFIWVPTALLFALSLVDDKLNMPIWLRLLAHLASATYLAAVLVAPHAGTSAALAAVLVVAWVTNLYNFMDGSDGLAGGMALIGFTSYAVAACVDDQFLLAAACLTVAAAVAPFLYCNFHPAKVFLGDSGSVPLGFLAASFGIEGWLRDVWPVWFPLLVFSPFIVDATITLLRRFLRRERVWRAHREHYYQRLVRLGWGHRRTAVVEYVLMVVCALAALTALRQPVHVQSAIFIACALLYLVLAICVDRAWRRRHPEF